MADQFNLTLDSLNEATNKYIDDLIGEAGGDRDYIVRKLDAEFDLALGTDDGARADFLQKVSDSLEQRIGRIPYDYEKFSARELEDYARGTTRLKEDTSTALARLGEDERVLKEENKKASMLERRTQQEELASRGLLEGTRDQAQGIAGTLAGELDQDITNRDTALDRAIGRERFDIGLGQTRGLEDFDTAKNRNLADITTTARRGAIDEQNTFTFGTEAANREYEKTKKSLERQRQTDKLYNQGFSAALS